MPNSSNRSHSQFHNRFAMLHQPHQLRTSKTMRMLNGSRLYCNQWCRISRKTQEFTIPFCSSRKHRICPRARVALRALQTISLVNRTNRYLAAARRTSIASWVALNWSKLCPNMRNTSRKRFHWVKLISLSVHSDSLLRWLKHCPPFQLNWHLISNKFKNNN